MDGLRSGGRTVLFVSHNMAAVENLCSRCIWIDAGKVVMDGAPREVIEAYMNTFANARETMADLRSVQNRRGSGEIRYTAMEYLTPTGEPLRVVRSGDSLVVRFHYHAQKPIVYPSFGFRLYTEFGTLVTDTSTWHHGIDIPLVPPGDGYVDLHIEFLNLLPARYYFSLWITGAASPVHDNVEHCGQLDVALANVYSSGRMLDNRSGIVFFPQRWKVDEQLMAAVGPKAEEK